jgi:hypothetical protein
MQGRLLSHELIAESLPGQFFPFPAEYTAHLGNRRGNRLAERIGASKIYYVPGCGSRTYIGPRAAGGLRWQVSSEWP